MGIVFVVQRWIADLAKRIGRDANVSTSVNVATGPGARTSVKKHQRIVQRNGETVIHEETVEQEESRHDREA
jgi:hypothetical protein